MHMGVYVAAYTACRHMVLSFYKMLCVCVYIIFQILYAHKGEIGSIVPAMVCSSFRVVLSVCSLVYLDCHTCISV